MGTYFDKKKLVKCTDSQNAVLNQARQVDDTFDIAFDNQVPGLKEKDAWLEIVNICRASFAIASILAPSQSFPYGTKKKTSFEAVLQSEEADPELLPDLNRVVMHDAVLNIAIIWKDIRNTFE